MPGKIDRVDFHILSYALSRRYGDANGLKAERRTALVRITTAEGVVGWGEFFARRAHAPHLQAAQELLEGASALACRPLVEQLSSLSPQLAAGIDIALWDIRGKLAGMSVAQLLGGPYRATQPAYASLQNVCEADDVTAAAVDEAVAAIRRGYRSLKMKIGWHRPAVDAAWIEAVLDALPEDVLLAIDANRALDIAVARGLLARLKRPERIMWFEEPLSRLWPSAYAELKSASCVAIAGAESMDVPMTEGVIAARAMDIVNPDLVGHGGFAAFQRLQALCDVHGLRLVPHIFDGQLIRVATLHFLAAQPPWGERQASHSAAPLECDQSYNPLRDDLLEVDLTPGADGCIAVPSDPGLGVSVNERLLQAHTERLAA